MEQKVSVAICTWNGERWIGNQLQSILNQSRTVDEIIVGDDGSTDGTLEVIHRTLAASSIPYTLIQNPSNLGSLRNFENVCKQCQGDVIFLADQDDWWDPKKVEKILRVFSQDQQLGWVFSNLELCDENLSPIGTTMWEKVGFNSQRIKRFQDGEQLEVALKKPMVTGAALAVRKNDLLGVLPFQNPWIHDHWISLAFGSKNIKGFALSEPLVRYRLHQSQQVGAKQAAIGVQIERSVRTRSDSYRKECEALRLFLQLDDLSSTGIGLIEKKIQHFMARARILEMPRVRRIQPIYREWKVGNYRFSWSSFAPINDLLRG